jgi:hypothetical protein
MACQRRVRAAFGGDEVEGKDHACVEAEDALYYGRLRGRERGGTDDGFSEMKDLRQFWRVFVPEAFVAVSPFVVDAEGEGHEETLDLEDRDGVLPCFLFLACWGGKKSEQQPAPAPSELIPNQSSYHASMATIQVLETLDRP